MEIIIGKTAGFCYGVKRAVDGAKDILKKNNNVLCLGELVHNNVVINDLEKKGATFIDELQKESKNVIIRAHGIPKNTYNFMKENQINYYDYTCPNVLNIHKIAEEYAQKEYFIFLLGDSKHPENIGTISFCGDKSFIIGNESCIEEAMKCFENSKMKKILIISQTTFSVKAFNDIAQKIKEIINIDVELVIKNTICNATELRQRETDEISKRVDYMIIIGGKNSSNTKKLFDIASANCKNAVWVESNDELNIEEIKKYNIIGIMAGASTPQSSIEEIKQKLLSI